MDTGGYSSPEFYDFNQDYFPELFVGTSTDEVIFYQNREILSPLKKIKALDLSSISWNDPP